MRKLEIFTAATAFAAFGFAGATMAQTQLLVNPDAESLPPMTGWNNSTNVDAVTVQVQSGNDALSKAGARFFTFADSSEEAAGWPPTSMDQDVDVSGCNIEELGLFGKFSAGGFVQTENDHEGELDVEFFDAVPNSLGTTSLTGIKFPQDGGSTYSAFGVMGNIPAGAVTANYMISGVLLSGGFINLFLDDLELTIDCVVANARINGTMGVRPGRKDPAYAFGGAVGTLEGGGVVGAITIDYRELGPTRCTFTPTTIDYTDDTSVAITAHYSCEGGDKDGYQGTDMTIYMTARDAHASCDESDKNARKNRGSIAVNSNDDDDLDISGGAGATRVENCLATGNVIIAGPVE